MEINEFEERVNYPSDFDPSTVCNDSMSWRRGFEAAKNKAREFLIEKKVLIEIECEHNWISAVNDIIQNGFYCNKCGSVSLDGETVYLKNFYRLDKNPGNN